jgi:hypothetical protein
MVSAFLNSIVSFNTKTINDMSYDFMQSRNDHYHLQQRSAQRNKPEFRNALLTE